MTEPIHPRIIGKYEVLSVLGKGGMGVVYKARDTIIDRIVAIKTIISKDQGQSDDQQLLARLRMEAKSAGRLQHPNIVSIYDFGQQDDLTFLVMEYVEGSNLSRIINSGAELPLNTKIDMVVRLCEGLAYAHDLGVIHRDIKPSNICVTKTFDPKILDFGLARFDETRLTRTGLVSGTISYMSPERLMGESGPSDDIFALGAVSYEIFTSQSAFPGKTMAEIVTNIRSGHFPVPPSQVADLPVELDTIIARATAPEKAKRYSSAADFARALRDLQHSATFQRRVANENKSVDAALNTVSIQLSMENPYTAPDLRASKVAGRKISDVHPVDAKLDSKVDQIDSSLHTAERQVDTPSGDKFSAAHYIPTEMLSRPVLTPPPDQPSSGGQPSTPPSPKTDEVPIPTASGRRSIFTLTRTVADLARSRRKPGQPSTPPSPKTDEVPIPTPTGRRSILTLTRTVVDLARSRRKPGTHIDAAEPQKSVVMKAVAQQAKTASPLRIALAGFALIVAIAATGIAAASGVVAFLVAYAAAVAAWFFLVHEGEHVSLRTIAFIAFPLHILGLFQEPLTRAALDRELAVGRAIVAAQPQPKPPQPQSQAAAVDATPPVASLLVALWASIGGSLAARRLLMIIAALTASWFLWNRAHPRRALAFATFPLVIVEGTINARFEIITVVLLIAAFSAIVNKRDGLAALCGVTACGVTTTAVVALPVLYDAAWQMFVFMFSAAGAAILPRLILPGAGTWSGSFTAMFDASPLLSFLANRTEWLLHERGITDAINRFLVAFAKRSDTTTKVLSEPVFAGTIVCVVILIMIGLLVQRARTTEAALADGIGVMLLLAVVREPAAWLLVVPFALGANRRFWLLIAVCSPILMLATSESATNWLIYVASLALPAAWYLGLKLQDMASDTPAARPARAS